MPRKPTTPQPSPDHYWNSSKGVWKLRKGIRKLDPVAEAARLAQLKLEASIRPPRTGKAPSNPYQTMSAAQFMKTIEGERVLEGEVLPPPEMPKPEPAKTFEDAERRLRSTGLDAVLALIVEGHSQREICEQLGVRVAHLNRWIDSTPGGDTRVRDSRRRAAQAWIDRGLAQLENAKDAMQLAKAREIAAMCKKYASIADPAYSDRVQVDTTVKTEDPAQIDARLRLLAAQVAAKRASSDDESQQ